MTFDLDPYVFLFVGASALLVVLSIYLALRRFFKMAQVTFTVNITINPAQTQPLTAVANPLNLTGAVGVAFTSDLSQNLSGGTPPYTLAITGNLPAGLSASGSVISGTPTEAGTSTLSVVATDSGA